MEEIVQWTGIWKKASRIIEIQFVYVENIENKIVKSINNMLIKIRKCIWILLLVVLSQNLFSQEVEEIIIKKDYYVTSVHQILKELERTYQLYIDYDFEDVRGIMAPSQHYNMPLNDFLAAIFNSTDIHFKIVEDQIVIRKKGVAIGLKDKVYERKSDFTLTGIVRDKASGEALPFAQIQVQDTKNGTSTNVDGYFTLFHIPSDTSQLLVTYVGYKKKVVFLTPRLVSKPITIELLATSVQLDDITVVGEREDLMQMSEKVSVATINPKEIGALPILGEKDIFRTFQLLPGVSGSNEGSSGLYVRGGTPDQNLILYDGFTVYHVDHLFGMFSAFNSNAIKDVQLYKGGFESKFGGRISSVMDIVGKSGNEKHFNLGFDIGFLSINGFLEIPAGDKLTILVAGRRSFQSPLYENIFSSFQEESQATTQTAAPATGKGSRTMASTKPSSYFYDLNAKVTYKPTDKDIISYSFFNGVDDLDNSRTFNRTIGSTTITGGFNDLTKWGNWGMSTKWSRKWNDKFYSNALVSYSNYFSLRDRTGESTRLVNEEYVTIKRGTLEDNNLQDYSFRLDNEYEVNKNNSLEFGLQANHFNIKYDYTQNDTTIIQNRDDIGSLYAVYVQDTWEPFNRFTIMPGLRVSYFDVSDQVYYEPRLSLSYKPTNRLTLKAAWGHYYQFVQRVIREDISAGSKDFWILTDGNTIPVGFSEHFIVGARFETSDFLFDVEAYYKKLSGLTEYTLRYIPQFGNINYDEFFYEGDGYAQGIEFLAQKKFGKFTGWAGYTLGEVIHNFPVYGDNPFHASHDVTHEFKFVGSYKLKAWTLSATWIYATGKPYTEPVGGYQIELPDGSIEDFISVGPKNGARYPDYHRLDLAVSRNFKLGDLGLGSVNFSIFNLYNKQNVWYKEFEIDNTNLTETDVTLLGITPNVTLSFKLR